jgi:glutaredoxin
LKTTREIVMGHKDKVMVTIYSRPDCHLCHDAEAVILGSPCYDEMEIQVVNIDDDPRLLEQYRDDIPVVLIGGVKVFKHRVSAKEFCRKLRRLGEKRVD